MPFNAACQSWTLWLKRSAGTNQQSGASRTFVVCRGEQVVGYCALAAGSVDRHQAPGRIRRNMPDPIPVVSPCPSGRGNR